ncbi:helix-turn-helix domain-containing protein [Mycobacterium pseudokansasii]|uniref:helix-turn-helix domain-containing protein n=1 Tax=Mycobacterium pseudokansasii TaxID=2341080 RepID=UPI0007B52809|nr:helix-turn-helix domain-containing protein [Mycobacterium pseudokansasii]KZS65583.1 hypothetical protein A4G27_05485 [Mycobacterium kansasii]VAZ98565.1 hypothetical protein LAUMK35_04047 [Mycobacterium pseudokansasii]VAZ99984.1 hypothetical protein LAUMK21_04043 [Mycobacterium pseudokansasii]
MSPGRSNEFHAHPESPTAAVLSAEQLAERWDLKPSTICARCKDGTIPGFRIGRTWRILIADVEAIESGDRTVNARITKAGARP